MTGENRPAGTGTPPIGVGAEAPDFPWQEDGVAASLAGRRGVGPSLLLFYPLAFAPVCRADLLALETAAQDLGHPRLRLLALSVDGEQQARRFFESLKLTALVAVPDPALRIAAAYGVRRREGVAQRASVLVDEHGRVAYLEVHSLCFPRPLEELRARLAASPRPDQASPAGGAPA